MSPETPLIESKGEFVELEDESQFIEKTSSIPVMLDGDGQPATFSGALEPGPEDYEAAQAEYQAKMEQALAEFQQALRTTVHTLGAKKYDFQVGNCEVLMGTGVQGVLNDGTFLTIPWHAIQRIVSIDTRPLEARDESLVP